MDLCLTVVQDAYRAFSSGTLGSSRQQDNHIWSSELPIRSWFKNKNHLPAAVAVTLQRGGGAWVLRTKHTMTPWRALLWRTRCGWAPLPRTQSQVDQDKSLQSMSFSRPWGQFSRALGMRKRILPSKGGRLN